MKKSLRSPLRALAGVSVLALLSACGGEKANKTATAEVVEPAVPEAEAATQATAKTPEDLIAEQAKIAKDKLAESEAFLAQNALKEAVTVLPSGLQYQIVETGVEGGDSPVTGDLVEVQYTGTLMDGTVFDSSRERGAAARFPLEEGLIPGWLEGMALMSEGDRYVFTLPPALAYGEQGTPGGPIPPNEALTFDVELVQVLNAEKNLKLANAFFAENAKKDGITTTASGLQYRLINRGDEQDRPNESDRIEVHFRSMLTDGTEFNNTYSRGAPIILSVASEIAGLTEGLQLMSPGDKYEFFIPPGLGYGEAGAPRGVIGPNEGMVFEVELLKIISPDRNLKAAQAFLEENAKADGIKVTKSGLQYKIVKKAGGDKSPTPSDRVKVHYRGTLTDGTKFDSSYDRGTPATFGVGQVIAGWTEGLQLMSEGDTFEFFIPPDLGYGERGTPTGSIGPNNALIFQVELLEVNPQGE